VGPDVASPADGLRARDAALIGRRTRRAATSRKRGIPRVDRRAARFERMRRRRSAVVEQRAEHGVLIRDVAGRVAGDAAAGGVPDEVEPLRFEREEEAGAVGGIAVGMRGAARQVGVAGDDRVPHGDGRDAGETTAAAGPQCRSCWP
jgi:hypothetical protein